MVGVMFRIGDKVIFNGGDGVYVPVGSKGTIIKEKEYGHYFSVYFENGKTQTCEPTCLSHYFSISDKIKIIGPISRGDNRFLGFEGTVISVDPQT